MSVIFEQAKPEVCDLAQRIMEQHHKQLQLADGSYPRLAILMATCSKGPPLKEGKRPCYGKVKIIPYIQRVDKRRDVEMLIDEKAFKSFGDRTKEAFLDRLITYLQVNTDELGSVKTDDAGRPELVVKLEDYCLRGFHSIAIRYGADSLEVMEARAFEKIYGANLLRSGQAELFVGAK